MSRRAKPSYSPDTQEPVAKRRRETPEASTNDERGTAPSFGALDSHVLMRIVDLVPLRDVHALRQACVATLTPCASDHLRAVFKERVHVLHDGLAKMWQIRRPRKAGPVSQLDAMIAAGWPLKPAHALLRGAECALSHVAARVETDDALLTRLTKQECKVAAVGFGGGMYMSSEHEFYPFRMNMYKKDIADMLVLARGCEEYFLDIADYAAGKVGCSLELASMPLAPADVADLAGVLTVTRLDKPLCELLSREFVRIRGLRFEDKLLPKELHPEVGGCTDLMYLDMTGMKLEEVPAVVYSLPKLRRLYIGRNPGIKRLPRDMGNQLRKLRYIELHRTGVKVVPESLILRIGRNISRGEEGDLFGMKISGALISMQEWYMNLMRQDRDPLSPYSNIRKHMWKAGGFFHSAES